MPPIHAKKPSGIKESPQMCAHGGPMHCNAGCYSKGGEVGVHESAYNPGQGGKAGSGGVSVAGHNYREGRRWNDERQSKRMKGAAIEGHKKVLGELRADKTDRRNLAEGGDVEPLDEPMQDDDHEEIESVLAGELLTAMEKKDKKGVVDAIEALVLQCMNKGGM